MTQDEIKQLRDLADRATPGPWSRHAPNWPTGYMVTSPERDEDYPVAANVNHADAEYLAALPPERIKELCDLAERGARVWECAMCDKLFELPGELCGWCASD